MTESEIQQRIIDLYNNKKEDFPASLSKTSFAKARKYYRFMDKIELEFGVCFSYNDLDKPYDMEALTKKVSERLGNRKSNMAILKQRQAVKTNYIFEIVLVILVIPVFIWRGIDWLSISLAIISVALIYWLASSKMYSNGHNKKLQQKIGSVNSDS